LAVATSLRWYGEIYHWRRRVGGEVKDLDRVFQQDIFDFRAGLRLGKDNEWPKNQKDEHATMLRFEVRSRNNDTLKAPYWRALWGGDSLPELVEPADPRAIKAREQYIAAGHRDLLDAYLSARTHALRWLDERITKDRSDPARDRGNPGIVKPPLLISDLQHFELVTGGAAGAALEFLQLDQHVKLNDWTVAHIPPPAARVMAGETLPVCNIRIVDKGRLDADLDLDRYGITPVEFSRRSSIGEGAFIRLSPRPINPNESQTLRMLQRGGSTCRVTVIDWGAGTVQMSPIPNFDSESPYLLPSKAWNEKEGAHFKDGTLDESVSDFVAGHVDTRLRENSHHPACTWLDPYEPRIPPMLPLAADRAEAARRLLASWRLPGSGQPLAAEQQQAVLDGLDCRIHLLKGPPGTGKTATTAAAILTKCAFRHTTGDVILIGANTHRATNELVERLAAYAASFRQASVATLLAVPKIMIARVRGRGEDGEVLPDGVERLTAESCTRKVSSMRKNGITIIAGTTATLLKMVGRGLNGTGDYKSTPFEADALVVDEASMMVFPHFLALATLVSQNASIMLAGDDLQLAPIVAHDWESEDRPPAQRYQPFRSAYESVLRLIKAEDPPMSPACARQSALSHSFRLSAGIRDLIGPVYHEHDGIALLGRPASDIRAPTITDLSEITKTGASVVLVLHDERGSRQYNPFEGGLVERIVRGADLLPDKSIAVIVPHRAQRAYLQELLSGPIGRPVSVVDTVERLQGGERPTVIVSATESDPYAIGEAAEFILNLNRANVAFSRAQKHLIVVCAESLLDHIPPETEDYKSAVLWKSLRARCRREIFSGNVDGHHVRVLAADEVV
jgi:hypothetical protein